MSVAVAGLSKRFPGRRGAAEVVALDGVDLEARDGELLVVMGPSGSGKSTLLRCIAGLERAEHGRVEVGGRDVTALAPGERHLSMVFQDLALYPHLTVAANIGFGLRGARVERAEIAGRVATAAGALGLDGLLDRRPAELSGGERQRVALARAIVREPAAFLLDEPLTHMDTTLHASAREEIRALQRRLAATAIYVTHDPTEAMSLGDRVAVLRAGRVEQVGTPLELYDSPATVLVARLFGVPPMSVVAAGALGPLGDGAAEAGLRPERVRLTTEGAGGRVEGEVVQLEHLGAAVLVYVQVAEASRVAVRVDRDSAPAIGARVGLAFADADVHRFDATGRRM